MVLSQILDWVNDVGQGFLFLAVLVWGFSYWKQPKAIQWLGIYLVLNLIIQLVAAYMWQNRMNNLPLLHVNTLLEFVFFSLFFRYVYIDQQFFTKYFTHILILGSILLILNSLLLESIFAFNTQAKVLVQICLIAYVLLYFFDAFGRVDFSQTEGRAISFICFAILMYYAGSLFIFMFGQISSTQNLVEEYRLIWIVNGVLTTIFQLIVLISIAQIAIYRKRSSP